MPATVPSHRPLDVACPARRAWLQLEPWQDQRHRTRTAARGGRQRRTGQAARQPGGGRRWGERPLPEGPPTLERFPPSPPAVVLDVGGGAGVDALTLAGRGFEVHLLDPVALHVEQARAASAQQSDAPLAAIELADARALPRPAASCDAVLLLGPLYHLPDTADRARALAEARRVLRPGALLLAAAIPRFAPTWDGLAQGFLDEPGFEGAVERVLADGLHTNAAGRARGFTTAFLHLPDELRDEVRDAGFADVRVLAVEGPASWLPDEASWLLDPERRERLLRAV